MIIQTSTLTSQAIHTLQDQVHDRWLDLSECTLGAEAGAFVVRFGEKKRGPYPHRLAVYDVKSVDVADDAQLGIYDIRSVEIDPARGLIQIRSAFPLTIRLAIGRQWRIVTSLGASEPNGSLDGAAERGSGDSH